MAVALIIAAIAGAVLAVTVALLLRQRAALRAQVRSLEQMHAETADALAAAQAVADERGAALAVARTERDAVQSALTAERERAAECRRRAEHAERQLHVLRTTADPPGQWTFERQRLCRLWRDWVSVTLEGECPIPEDPADAVRDAVGVLAAASREECGVPIEVAWDLDRARTASLSVEEVLALLRAAEELIAAARGSDGGSLRIAEQGGELALVLEADPHRAAPPVLASASPSVGWRLLDDGATLTIVLPTVRPIAT